MAMNNTVVCDKLPAGCDLNAYIVLTRLSQDDIERCTSTSQNMQSSLNPFNQVVTIKEEPEDNHLVNDTAETYENTEQIPCQQEYLTNIKVEPNNSTMVKSEPVDIVCESTVASPTILDCNEDIPERLNCNICFMIFDTSNDVIVHKYFSHKEKRHICKICNEKFDLNAHLLIHLSEHTDNVCSDESNLSAQVQQSSSSNNYTTRLLKLKSTLAKNPPNPKNGRVTKSLLTSKNAAIPTLHKCKNCTFTSLNRAKCSKHQNSCNINPNNRANVRQHHCHLCPRSFINQTSLNGHMRYHSIRGEIVSKRTYAYNRSNKIPNKIIPQKVIITKELGNITKVYKCKDCNRNFISQNKLNNHNLQHQKQMMCNFCNKQFFLKKRFEIHMLKHKDNEQNDNRSSLNSTDDQSEIEKPIDRKPCPKSTFKKYNGTNSGSKTTRLLIKIKSYQCSYCKIKFTTDKSLANHIRLNHSVLKPQQDNIAYRQCEWCNIQITRSNLHRHIRVKHPETRSLNCSYCLIQFNDLTSMRLHFSECHKKVG